LAFRRSSVGNPRRVGKCCGAKSLSCSYAHSAGRANTADVLPPDPEQQFLKNIFMDQKAIWTSPFHLQAEAVRWLAPIGATTATLIDGSLIPRPVQ
jgi:hypothetical protein